MEIKINVETNAMKKINYMSWQMIIYMIFTKRMVLSNCSILMMLNIERAQALFFCLQCDSADNRTLFVRQKRKRKRGQNVFDERINVYT